MMITFLRSLFRRPTSDENRTEIDLRYTIGGFGLLLAWATASIWFAVPDAKAVVLLWALACLMSGFLTGFLFGIPKVEQLAGTQVNAVPGVTPHVQAAAPLAAPLPYHQQINTNLEQISDWLTKIIVGLGLVELKQIPGALHRFATVLAASLPNPESRVGFCTGVIIAFCTLGFLTGYLITRMFFAGAFSRADRDSLGLDRVIDAEERTALEHIQLDPQGRARELDVKADEAAKKVEQLSLDELKTPKEVALWARAQVSSSRYEDAKRGFLRAIELDGTDPQFHYDLAITMSIRREDINAVIAELEKARGLLRRGTDPELRRNIYKSLTFHALYLPRPQSFEKCIQCGGEYVNSNHNLPSTSVWINLAAAYGQRATFLIVQKADAQLLEENRNKALFAVKEAVRLDVTNTAATKLLRLLVKDFPGKPESENDLEIYEKDNDFRKALGLPIIRSAQAD